jgi:hypothetical protein
MTTPHRPDPPKTSALPKTAFELAGWSIRELGMSAVLAVFVFLQWQADQKRTERIEAILIGNAEVLRSNSLVMERLGVEWHEHETTAKNFIENITNDVDQIKANTSRPTP